MALTDEEKTLPAGVDPAEARAVRIEQKLDKLVATLGRHMGLWQQDHEAMLKLEHRVSAIEAVPPPRRRRVARRPNLG